MSLRFFLLLTFASSLTLPCLGKDALSLFHQYSQEGTAAFKCRNDAEAERLWRLAVAQAESFAPNDMLLAKSLHNLAIVCDARGNAPEAIRLLKRALAVKERLLGPDDPEVAITLNNLGVLYFNQFDYKDAEACYKRVLAIDALHLPLNHPERITGMRNYIAMLRQLHRDKEANVLEDQMPPDVTETRIIHSH